MRHRAPNLGGTILCVGALLAVNIYLCRELFWTHYLNQMGSIEAVYIGLARYINENPLDLSWFPLWYNGIPFNNAYPPLLHILVALVASLFRCSPALAYHFLAASFYCLVPVTLFFLSLALSGSRAYSFFAGLLCSVLSPSAFVIPQIRHEIGFVRPRRLQALVAWGEGPHVAGLALFLVAILWLHRSVTRRRPVDCVICAILFAAVVLTNWLSAVALFAAALAYVCSTDVRRGLIVLPIAVLAYAIAAPFIPPSTVSTIRLNAPYLGDYGRVYAAMPRNLAVVALMAAIVILLVRRLTNSLSVRFAVIFAFLMAVVVLPAFYWNLYIVPQADRYHLELELALAILFVFAIRPLVDRVPPRLRVALALAAILAAIPVAKSDRRFARYLIGPIDIQQTIEYKAAAWLDRDIKPRRIFAAGSTQFWLNAFTDTPEITGGFDNGVVDQSTRIARYIIASGDGAGARHAEIAMLWLKALGAHAAVIHGPASAQAYHDLRNPRMFDGVLPLLWREGDDSVYQVPQRSDSLARVMTRGDLVARSPVNGIDIAPLVPYVAALDSPGFPSASFSWTTRHSASMQATLSSRHVVSVQIAYHPGWRALVNGSPVPVREDGIGQIYVEPSRDGPCRIDLIYDGGLEMRIARAVAAAAWIAAVVAIVSRDYMTSAKLFRRR